MDTILTKTIDPFTVTGPRRWANWDAELFDRMCQGPVRNLWKDIKKQPNADKVLRAYLSLVQEAIGVGYLHRGSLVEGSEFVVGSGGTFLTHCLLNRVPAELANLPSADQIPFLAKLWNLGEGLMQEPAWMDRYVQSHAAELQSLVAIEEFLAVTLEPVLVPTEPAQWKGPFVLTMLNTRSLLDDFLPGEMHLAGPMVLCVHDRRHDKVHLGIFLRPRQESRFIGLTPCLGAFTEETPKGEVKDGKLHFGKLAVDLPHLRVCHRHVIARAGFSIASAVDSQRLWIVESA
jgi:hypothetical protein